MNAQQPRPERRAIELGERRDASRRAQSRRAQDDRVKKIGFGLIVAVILGGGVYLAAGDLFGQRGRSSDSATIAVRMSMAGFTPSEIRIPAGQRVALELWTTDAAPHLQGGVHTMISDELGIYEKLPAAGVTGESRNVVFIETPTEPGTYDIYCNTCCGGKDSPTMHGRLVIEG